MFLARSIAIIFSSVLLFFACSSDTQNQSQDKQENIQLNLESFFAQFPKTTLPVALPLEQIAESKALDKTIVQQIFSNSAYKPAIGTEKDVPDLADNAESAKYFAEGIFRTDGYTAVIIRKIDDVDTYYYLSTFDAEGQYVDGMCVAFTAGADAQRIASINDDYSIQIGQTEKTDGAAPAETRVFFEILENGQINSLNNNGAKMPV
ncbi:MAG: hypothetical protein ACXWEY_00720 [Bacteroidia bacterium]